DRREVGGADARGLRLPCEGEQGDDRARGGRPREGFRRVPRGAGAARERGQAPRRAAAVPASVQEVQGGDGGAEGGRAATRPACPARRVPTPLVGRGGRARRQLRAPRRTTPLRLA